MTYVLVSDNPARTKSVIEKIKPNILDVDIVIPDVEINLDVAFEDLSDHVHEIVNSALDAAYKIRNHCQFVIDIDSKDIMTFVAAKLFVYSHIVTLDDRTRFRAERDYWTEAAVVIGDRIVLMD